MLDTVQLQALLPGTGIPPTSTALAVILGSCASDLVALAGGGAEGATPITAVISHFSTVATAGDSALLPAAVPGMVLFVINNGAAPLNAFPASGEKINGATDTAFAINSATMATFACAGTGEWGAA